MATPALIVNQSIPTIALIGRVNVGKSSLFNKLTEGNKALVSTFAGTTRTNNEAYAVWRGKYLRFIDTGGLTFQDDIPLEEDIIKQTEHAVADADLILFVTDAQTGILPQERDIAKRLQKHKNKTILVANKIDTEKLEPVIYDKEFLSLGMGDAFPVSAASGRNLGDLLDEIFSKVKEVTGSAVSVEKPITDSIKIALMGKPNVGKSSLFNKLIGEDKVIVSDMAHTTREPHDTLITYTYDEEIIEHTPEGEVKKHTEEKKQNITFIDTAGIRRKKQVTGFLEKIGIIKSFQSVDKADMILFVIDANEPLAQQDMQLGGYLEKHAKSTIILINKWDLTEDNAEKNRKEVERRVRSYFPHLSYAPVLFVSGKTGFRVHQIFPMIMDVWRARHTEIGVKALEYFLKETVRKHKPSRGKGTRHPELLGIKQMQTAPPIFEIAVKYRTSLHRSYINFIENRMREQFDFTGTPIIIKLRKTKR